jgi:uncharacterized protein YjbJ (UPF0337 family)
VAEAGDILVGAGSLGPLGVSINRRAEERALIEIALVKTVRRKRGNIKMKPSTKDQIEGTLHDMKGKLKEEAGKVTDNPKLTAEGKTEKLTGKVQKKVGQIEKVLEK